MAEILPMPGDACRHHTRGRCLYEEHLNPGYCSLWQCRAFAHWESAFDDFLARAELFGLEQERVASLWERRFARIAHAFDCDRYSACTGADTPVCIHARDGLCRLALPVCEGRCRHYRLPRMDNPESGPQTDDPADQ
jgi:hypothetical protein